MTFQKTLSVIIPVYNEEELLERNLTQISEVLSTFDFPTEIIVIDDGSTDRTPTLLDSLAAGALKGKIRALHHEKNGGIGLCYKTGIKSASMEYLLFLVLDINVSREYLLPFVDKIGQADVLVGVRRARKGYTPLMRFNSWIYVKIIRFFFGLKLRDVNWICIYPKKLLEKVEFRFSRIAMLAETLIRCHDLGASFLEIPTEQTERKTLRKSSAAKFSIMLETLLDLIRLIIQR